MTLREQVDSLVETILDAVEEHQLAAGENISANVLASATFTLAIRTAVTVLELSDPAQLETNRLEVLRSVRVMETAVRAWLPSTKDANLTLH